MTVYFKCITDRDNDENEMTAAAAGLDAALLCDDSLCQTRELNTITNAKRNLIIALLG